MGKVREARDVRLDLRAVVYPHQKWWIAHCLELDLVAEGPTPASAIRDLVEISISQVETAQNGEPRINFLCGAPEIWAMFSRAGDPLPMKKQPSRFLERFEAREALLA